ncbi:MAG: ABC transporter ATP-binding protein [Aggregatilineales bacterium]
MLELSNITIKYGAVTAVHDVSLKITEGEFVALIGSNGAGKTTILRAISGLQRVAAGRVLFEGQPIENIAAHRVTKLGIAHVPEGRQVFPDLTVMENLEMGGFIWRNHPTKFNEQRDLVLSLFPKLAERSKQKGGTLSGGEQQMLAVGRAMMARPKVLLLDEPSLGLAPLLVHEMFTFITKLHQETGLTILLVEQLAEMALGLAQKGYVLENGRIVLEGESASLKNDPRIQQIYLGTSTVQN